MKAKSNFRPKSFAVVGAGPVGCIVAAFLAKGGYDVTLCDVFPELLKPVLNPGIIIEGAENLQQAVTRTCTSIDDLADIAPDVIFLTVKANALPLISSAIEGFYKEGMYVISWQNGIDTEAVIAQTLGKKPVMRAVVNYGCGLVKPGHVRMPFHHPPHFLQELAPESAHAAVTITEILTKCGLPTSHTDMITSMVWRKAILNSCMNPVCAVTGLTMAQAMGDPIVFQIVDALVKECVKVARANEVDLGWGFYPGAIEYMRKAGDHKPSMLMDIENKRRTEIDYMNGKFIEYGAQAGIETPYNIMIRSLVKAIESKK
ncbi:MAG: 2-dehydropantoate 2-reductase [Proteobacteria bacterium]|nr:2-dehydropantoate 2-reductase [Pseudomonadota bacterium]MBU1570741.1 2-dehydropantoate 2-reductase [Pseudomonadota bacterium]